MELEASAIAAAHTRLRGQLVDTPIVAGIVLPGRAVSVELRAKVECLQQGGSIYFRAAQHWLGRHFGSLTGILVSGSYRVVLATAHAAKLQRTPCRLVLHEAVSEDDMSVLRETGAEMDVCFGVEAAAARVSEIASETGYRQVPAIDDSDHALGIATLGLELAAQLGSDVIRVYVAPAELAGPIHAGLMAGGRELLVEGVELHAETTDACSGDEGVSLRRQILCGMRVDVGPASLAAFAAALDCGEPACAVLAD